MLQTLGIMAVMATLVGCNYLLENQLFDDLMRDYNKNVIPTTEKRPVVIVEHSLSVIKILKFDHDELQLGTWEQMMWTDERLKWDPTHYNNINKTHILYDLIWIPDIVTYNFDVPDHEPHMENLRVVVTNIGLVTFYPASVTTFRCKVSTSGEEIYTCYVKIGSWVYSGNKMDIASIGGVLNLSDMIEDDDWTITNSTVTHQVARYDCCPDPYPTLTYMLELKPKHHRHRCA
ncbi:neuronal acetylcholine receptor subunit alpha-2-like [Argopecten irradians]|uniref:neuronal acetylcholine receptor subunit alpha-2-like n=1 Tax=Argopecten irradians TaxID=31199 RepID=UPI003723170C